MIWLDFQITRANKQACFNTVVNEVFDMNKLSVLILFYLLGACAFYPPKPAECKGAFKPVNASAEKVSLDDKHSLDAHAKTSKVVLCDKGAAHG